MYLFLKQVIIFILRNLIYLFPQQSYSLRIITLHDIHPKHFKKLYETIKILQAEWNFITAESILKRQKLIGKNILLTFDDGFLSQKKFTEKYLNKLKIKAIFFIITDFADIKNKQKSVKFIKSNIDKKITSKKVHKYFYNMSWKDIKDLKKQGHYIGCHTKSHKQLTRCASQEELKNEIKISKIIIEKKIKNKVKFFAYPYGNVNSIDRSIIKKLRNEYNCIFSGFRGNNIYQKKNFFMRDAIEPENHIDEVLFYLNGFIDKIYKSKYLKFI